jgi:hypothetical protein
VTRGGGFVCRKPAAPRYLEAFILTPDFFSPKDILTGISHRGREGLQPRRYVTFLIIPVSRDPRSLRLVAAATAGRETDRKLELAFSAGPKPRPSGGSRKVV